MALDWTCRRGRLDHRVGVGGCSVSLRGVRCRKPTPNPAPPPAYGIVSGCNLLHFRCLWLTITVVLLHFGQCIGHFGIMHRPSRPDDAHTALQPQIVQLLVQLELHVHAAHVARHTPQVAIAQQHLVGIVAGV